MRNISKGAEPKSLTKHRCSTNSDYGNYSEKDELRISLVKEQRGLCCYCMQRIRPNVEGMKIEHWQCQSRFPQRQLDYSNLLGACLGCEGQEPNKQHCDTRKGDRDLTYNPANPDHNVESMLKFLGDGTIASEDPDFYREIIEVLNLNEGILIKNRKAVLDVFLKEVLSANLSSAKLEKELKKWRGDGSSSDLPEFCQVIIYYLDRKIRTLSNRKN
ncbi:retron system putative HNH endonuclease [Leptolyngbya sp. CCY15150]|jgi:uncharacterized protein (TIGR02646 family)|uniref:retron system putative HNH endonuclease n=1 Tax=Leptolyngbya sp. CCY15150 TaxID=2767772 RepID=UPI00194FAF0A|nr:retron system putative HNH endonuclease [Leptolyngbya sp. CCY15150]